MDLTCGTHARLHFVVFNGALPPKITNVRVTYKDAPFKVTQHVYIELLAYVLRRMQQRVVIACVSKQSRVASQQYLIRTPCHIIPQEETEGHGRRDTSFSRRTE